MTKEVTHAAKYVEICVDRDGWSIGIQLSINCLDASGSGVGYRLSGPKYNGTSTPLTRHRLTARDAEEIRRFLDLVFPIAKAEGR